METSFCTQCQSHKSSDQFTIGKFGKQRKLCDECIRTVSDRYARRKGVECMWCGKPSDGKVYCEEHRLIIRDKMREKRATAPPRVCQSCGVKVDAFKQLCEKCGRDRNLACQKRWNRERVETLYAKYGGAKCVCCGETIFEFLSLDHIENNGAAHRREIGGSGSHLYGWIVRKNYPPGFQVLCYNCNAGRYRNGGICPHQISQLVTT